MRQLFLLQSRRRNPATWLSLGLLVLLAITGCDSDSPSEPEFVRAGFTFVGEGPDVKFSDSSTGPIQTWFWEFGDGDFSNDTNPVHSYNAANLPRTYTVRLEVCPSTNPDDGALCSTATKRIRVLSAGSPVTP